MMFSPLIYNSLDALIEASIMGAHSDTTTIDGVAIFGWFDGKPYAERLVFCAISEATYTVAGDCITE
jgi:hypothetical protein